MTVAPPLFGECYTNYKHNINDRIGTLLLASTNNQIQPAYDVAVESSVPILKVT